MALEFLDPIQPNEKVIYSYEHSLNGKSKTVIHKHGVFIRKVKHPRKYWTILHRKQMAVVQFIGNKNESRVEYSQLRRKG